MVNRQFLDIFLTYKIALILFKHAIREYAHKDFQNKMIKLFLNAISNDSYFHKHFICETLTP